MFAGQVTGVGMELIKGRLYRPAQGAQLGACRVLHKPPVSSSAGQLADAQSPRYYLRYLPADGMDFTVWCRTDRSNHTTWTGLRPVYDPTGGHPVACRRRTLRGPPAPTPTLYQPSVQVLLTTFTRVAVAVGTASTGQLAARIEEQIAAHPAAQGAGRSTAGRHA